MLATVRNTDRHYNISVILLILIYIAGIVGLQHPVLRPYFKLLVPVSLLTSLIMLLWYHTDWRGTFWVYAVGAVLVGFWVEVIGVHTGLIFGKYAYGPVLGPHVLAVPPVIGLNWLLLSYCCGSICDQLKVSWWAKAVVASSLMVGLDLFIEPVAIQLDFWSWFGQPVPAQNYIAWWVISCFLFLAWYRLPFRKTNRIAPWLFMVQFFFFVVQVVLSKVS